MQFFSESTIFALRHQNTLERPCWQAIAALGNDKTPVCHAERGLAFGGKTRRGESPSGRAADRQAVDAQRGLAHAHRHALTFLAAGAHARVQAHVVAYHADVLE